MVKSQQCMSKKIEEFDLLLPRSEVNDIENQMVKKKDFSLTSEMTSFFDFLRDCQSEVRWGQNSVLSPTDFFFC